jgi:hypothetical protein
LAAKSVTRNCSSSRPCQRMRKDQCLFEPGDPVHPWPNYSSTGSEMNCVEVNWVGDEFWVGDTTYSYKLIRVSTVDERVQSVQGNASGDQCHQLQEAGCVHHA